MGFFWDLVQHSQISDAQDRATSLEARVERLERELRDTRELLHTLVVRLEETLGEDLDRDGRVGGGG